MSGNKITIAGLGPGSKDFLTLGVIKALQESPRILLRTKVHPVVPYLQSQGIVFESFDKYYEEAANFQELYRQIAHRVLLEARKGKVLYAVPGHPLVAEDTVQLIMAGAKEQGIEVEILPGASFLDAIFNAIPYDPNRGLQVLDGLALGEKRPDVTVAAVITQVYSPLVAAEVKLTLMDYYPDDHPVVLIRGAGIPGEERLAPMPLYQVDRHQWVDHLTSLFVPALAKPAGKNKDGCVYPLDPLVNVMATLRSDGGCPWDKEQTHQSLKPYLVEETYEVMEALDTADAHKICEELGDLLLQIVFHAQIAREKEQFNINDVVEAITEKMIRRHPHVFSDLSLRTSDEVLVNWDKIKEEERQGEGAKSLLDNIPKGLPALARAAKLQTRAARVGFDWPDYTGALEKVNEEILELCKAIEDKKKEEIASELGDLLFAVVNLGRLLDVDAEGALNGTNGKFVRRFQYIEEKARQGGKDLKNMTLEEMDYWWNSAKGLEGKKDGKNN
ncbi:nucleoside triphosphate pyrophosphohydrolase [Desulfofalx alkaliphila]|uniref:nucleoside triphosphate pyrophosphohydrolase n=1 Tax=Desulfofalx alkaliphila TaxID=105483 RepID=UPI0004E17AF7|nr:nucleoside triphosphate pyrophosphohydrolase [Desulfofalx alkaliphila]